MTELEAYITEQKADDRNSLMKQYVDGLGKKIGDVQWKQDLILKYNYLPLQMIKDKIQNEKQSYLKKLEAIQAKLQKQNPSQLLENHVDLFRDFRLKLESKINDIEQRIQIERLNYTILRACVEQKRDILKTILKQNAETTKTLISYTTQKYNSHRVDEKKKNIPSSNFASTKKKLLQKLSEREISEQNSTKNSQTSRTIFPGFHDIYQQCVNTLIKSLKNMNRSDDVQSGIYLQIMNRKLQTKAPIFSLKSKTCDVLMNRFRDLNRRHDKPEEDFNMTFQTFLTLNWKQIMGIILVKDRDAKKLKNIIKQ